jgi:TRAP-type transport system periplasmic protein
MRLHSRRGINLGIAAAGISLCIPRFAAAAEFEMRQVHNQPVDSPLHRRITQLWDAVAAETSGRVHVTVLPDSGEKQGITNPLPLLTSGELEFLTLAGNGLSALVPPADVQATPFAFANPAQVYAALDGDLGDYLREETRAKGLYLLPAGCFENGMHQLTSSVRPIRTAADIAGLKLRVPGSKLYQSFFQSLGADVHTMNLNRTHDALKAGQIDSQDDPFDDVELLKLYEFQKYASLTNHSWSGYNALANLKRWQSLPADVQRVIEANTRKYVQLQRSDTDRLNEELRTGLASKGMVINEVDRASFKPALTAFYPRWREAIGRRTWDLLVAHTGPLGMVNNP